MAAKSKKRTKILEEILSTEQEYVDNLETLYQVYEKPLLEKGESLGFEKSSHVKIFNDLGPIRHTNTFLLAELKKHVAEEKEFSKKPEKTIGEIFVNCAPFLKCYTTYCNQFNNNCTILRTIRKEHPELEKFLLAQQKSGLHNVNGRPINSFLILPVQRIPRYRLLLNELLEKTPKLHRDYEGLQKALQTIASIADFVNEKIRDFESDEKLVQLMTLFEEDMKKEDLQKLQKISTLSKNDVSIQQNIQKLQNNLQSIQHSDFITLNNNNTEYKHTRKFQIEFKNNFKFFSYVKHLELLKGKVNFYLFNDLILITKLEDQQVLKENKDNPKEKEYETISVEKYVARIHLDEKPYVWIRDIVDKYIPEISLGLGTLNGGAASTSFNHSSIITNTSNVGNNSGLLGGGGVHGLISHVGNRVNDISPTTSPNTNNFTRLSVPVSPNNDKRLSTDSNVSSASSSATSDIEIVPLNNAFQIITEDDVYVFEFNDFETKVKVLTLLVDNIHEFAKNALPLEYAQIHTNALIPYPFYSNEMYLIRLAKEEEKKKRKSVSPNANNKKNKEKDNKESTSSSLDYKKEKKGLFKFFKSKKHLKGGDNEENEDIHHMDYNGVDLSQFEITPNQLPALKDNQMDDLKDLMNKLEYYKNLDLDEGKITIAQAINTYRPHKFFGGIDERLVFLDSFQRISFHRGDIFIIYENFTKDYVIAKKVGLNSDPDRKQQILESYIPKDFETLNLIMKNQRSREGLNQSDPPLVKQLRRTKYHFIQIRDLMNELLEFYSSGGSNNNNNKSNNVRNSTAMIIGSSRGDDLLQKMDLLSLFEASENEKKKKRETTANNNNGGSENSLQKRKSLSALFGDTSLKSSSTPSTPNVDGNNVYETEDEESLFRNLINLYEEWNQVGLLPVKYIDEFKSNSTCKKLTRLIDWRNEQEEKKKRNFVIKKKKVVNNNNSSPQTPQSSTSTTSSLGNNSNNSSQVDDIIDDLGISCSVFLQNTPKMDSTLKQKELVDALKKAKKNK
ncbi:hypothetical protein ABK040_013139 [Willaertia magna]